MSRCASLDDSQTAKFREFIRGKFDDPIAATSRGIEGSVVVAFRTNSQGRPVEPKIWWSTPPGVFDLEVLKGTLGSRVVDQDAAFTKLPCFRLPLNYCLQNTHVAVPHPNCHADHETKSDRAPHGGKPKMSPSG